MSAYDIVPITKEHIESFAVALDSVAREGLYLAALKGPPLEKTQTFILEQLQNDMPHYVAVVKDKVVGWCDIASRNRPLYAHSGILGMGVLASYRGQGIGKALIKATIEKAKNKGLSRVELEVREKNERAISLYQKFGFVVEGLKRNATKIDGQYSNDLVMGLLL